MTPITRNQLSRTARLMDDIFANLRPPSKGGPLSPLPRRRAAPRPFALPAVGDPAMVFEMRVSVRRIKQPQDGPRTRGLRAAQ